MKKFLYIAPVLIDDNRLDGVAKKVLSQVSVFEKKYNSTLMSYSNNALRKYDSTGINYMPYPDNTHRRFNLYNAVSELVANEYFDYVYIRYPKSEFKFIDLLKDIKNIGAKIVIEIPTFPYHENDKTFKSAGILALDYVLRTQLKKYVDRIVTYSDDKEIFGVKTINTLNGIIFDNIECKKENIISDTINLIGVSAIRSIQGWDRIFKGMNDYYKKGGSQKILFNIVGDGPYLKQYHDLVAKYKLEDRVVFHGFQSGTTLDNLYNSADIGVNSIAIHREKLEKESTLKTKEYVAKGLPIISSYPIEAFSHEENSKYVLQVSPDETLVDIQSIIDFYNSLYITSYKQSLAEEIRESARKKCDMNITLQDVFKYFDLMGEVNG
ncbi:glycosyltransferase [Peribacillus frigoritolerans]|uniref:glycosyltransferase n=1 Tax=Peribacillus frigoritolerans TaxID=450367 RepID=UPI002B24EE4E|nr:glycosyltransferase [Peribacillus frigoritolerans]MEB2629677.1 glycosyltransferase [Peribacillus frigoritolerans]